MDHAAAVANAAIRFIRYLSRRNANAETQWHCRIGIGSGPVVGSVVGVQKYVYDVFGPAVDLANEARSKAAEMEALVAPAVATALEGKLELRAPRAEAAREGGLKALASV
jgi:adenylate cyclase